MTASGALPPYVGLDPTERAGCSPYTASMSELHAAFGHSADRLRLLRGLIEYRDGLRSAGIVDGFQLIDGSFTEDCETLRSRPPGDIDVVTYARIPAAPTDKASFMQTNIGLFRPRLTKATFHCDAYFVDLEKPGHFLVEDTTYLFGLFSHQRATSLWKGMVRVSLASDDDAVRAALQAAGSW